MNIPFDAERDFNYFRKIWETRNPIHFNHTKKTWDKWAKSWDDELNRERFLKERLERRIQSGIDFLQRNGALDPTFDVIDIGCGPFRFAERFAERVRTVTGMDHSEAMCRIGEEIIRTKGLTNLKVLCGDLMSPEVPGKESEKSFDLVTTFITPAVETVEALRKMNRMSRRFCFNSSFVETRNAVRDEIQRELFEEGITPAVHANWYYALWNMLWLSGYQPVTGFYREVDEIPMKIDEGLAERLTVEILLSNEIRDEDVGRVYNYLMKKYPEGRLINRKTNLYGYTLWNVSERIDTGRPDYLMTYSEKREEDK